jgi:hypothetical protein
MFVLVLFSVCCFLKFLKILFISVFSCWLFYLSSFGFFNIVFRVFNFNCSFCFCFVCVGKGKPLLCVLAIAQTKTMPHVSGITCEMMDYE